VKDDIPYNAFKQKVDGNHHSIFSKDKLMFFNLVEAKSGGKL